MYYLDNNLTALAIIPGILILAYVYRKDKVEKEPLGLIVKLIIAGVISCFAAGELEHIASGFFPQYPQGSVGYALVNGFALAAFWEEIVKYLALRLPSWRHRGFNYRFDGIVYGVSAAVGFAVYENIMYVAMFGLQTGIVRAFTAVPLHSFCGVFMGVFYAYSKKAAILGRSGESARFTFLALFIPMLIHGIYDFLAMLGANVQLIFLAFVVFMYVVTIKTINKMSAEDKRGGFYPQARTINYEFTDTDY